MPHSPDTWPVRYLGLNNVFAPSLFPILVESGGVEMGGKQDNSSMFFLFDAEVYSLRKV